MNKLPPPHNVLPPYREVVPDFCPVTGYFCTKSRNFQAYDPQMQYACAGGSFRTSFRTFCTLPLPVPYRSSLL